MFPERRPAAGPHRDRLEPFGVPLEDPPILAARRPRPEALPIAVRHGGIERTAERDDPGLGRLDRDGGFLLPFTEVDDKNVVRFEREVQIHTSLHATVSALSASVFDA